MNFKLSLVLTFPPFFCEGVLVLQFTRVSCHLLQIRLRQFNISYPSFLHFHKTQLHSYIMFTCSAAPEQLVDIMLLGLTKNNSLIQTKCSIQVINSAPDAILSQALLQTSLLHYLKKNKILTSS